MYSILYADPPWAYHDRTPRGGAEKHYRTMPVEGLAGLQVEGKHISWHLAPDCALFLWATWPLIADAFRVGAAWGFAYKTCGFLWVKTSKAGTPSVGLGHWTRGNSEPCLLFVRGKPARISRAVRQVVIAPRGKHSAKPPEVRERVVSLLGDVPRLELFARERVAGWDAFGDEVGA